MRFRRPDAGAVAAVALLAAGVLELAVIAGFVLWRVFLS